MQRGAKAAHRDTRAFSAPDTVNAVYCGVEGPYTRVHYALLSMAVSVDFGWLEMSGGSC